jgi:hypothetical protein
MHREHFPRRNHAPSGILDPRMPAGHQRWTDPLALLGAVVLVGCAIGAAGWLVNLSGGFSAEAASRAVSNLAISATTAPSAGTSLYPGDDGDVVTAIANPNPVSVTVSGVRLPPDTSYASGYSDAALTTAQAGCSAANSDVSWRFATRAGGTTHILASPLTVAGNSTLVVTLANDATASVAQPAACERTYFSMPALTAIAATAGAGPPTLSPAIDTWTS